MEYKEFKKVVQKCMTGDVPPESEEWQKRESRFNNAPGHILAMGGKLPNNYTQWDLVNG